MALKTTAISILLLVSVLRSTAPDEPAIAADAELAAAPDFNTHIAPLLQKYCVGCHNATDAEHGLVLESYESLLRGGDGGAVIVPGKSDTSRLLLMLDGRAKPAMPPEGNEAPTAAEIALVKSWIDAGAKSPTGSAPDPTLLVTPKVPLRGTPRRQINAVAISPDGKLAALAGYQEVRLLSTDSRAIVRKLSGHRGNVTDVEFSKDGTRLITAAGEAGIFGEVILWNVADGALLHDPRPSRQPVRRGRQSRWQADRDRRLRSTDQVVGCRQRCRDSHDQWPQRGRVRPGVQP